MKDKVRLHKFITKRIADFSNSNYTPKEIQNNIGNYGVYIDNRLITNRLENVFGNEKFSIDHWPQREKASYEGIAVIWEDSDFVLLYKPAGLPVQEGAGHTDNNLVNWLLKNIEGQKEIKALKTGGNNEKTAGLVHRIDKDTQGLLLVAKNYDALLHAQSQFRNRFVKKSYLSVLDSYFDDEIEVEGYQFRDLKNPIKQNFVIKENYENVFKQYPIEKERVKECKSIFIPLLTDGDRTLTIVKIHTGRMHQIRVAAEALGMSVVGEKVYTSSHKKLSKIDQSNLKRIEKYPKLIPVEQFENIIQDIFKGHQFMLLSNELVFNDMNNNKQEFRIIDIDKMI
ncbi:MAG: RluA family pseudouridine synthase [Patescibacteria group bacterium]